MKTQIPYQDFEKLDIRTAKIIKAEEITGADKLYKLTINLGKELGERTICAGIKKHYTPEQLQGKTIIVLANLEPRKLKGIESQGMLLAATQDNKVILLTSDKNTEAGMEIS